MKIHSLLTVAAVSILAASCTAGTSGIFASIEREQKVVSLGGLAKTATVTSMAELTSVTPHQYFATGGQSLFSRAVGTVTWNKSTVVGNTQVAAVGSVGTSATATTAVYAVAGGKLYKTTDGSNWQAVSLGSGDVAFNLVPIRLNDGVFNNELLVVTQQNDGYVNSNSENLDNVNVYRLNGSGVLSAACNIQTNVAATFTGADPFHGLSAPVMTCVTTDNGTTYYFASESYVWKWDGATTPAVVNVSFTPTNIVSGYQGLIYLTSTNTLYLSTRSNTPNGGSLYSTTNPTTTSLSFTTIASNVSINSKLVWFTQFLYNVYNASLWVATGSTTLTEGTGYMEISGTVLSPSPNTDTNNYGSTVLPTSAVGTLFADNESSTNPSYFLGTDSEGLWLWSSSSRTWSQQ